MVSFYKNMIVAMDEKNGIGKDNTLPWKVPSDLKRFRKLTTGCNVVMGRATYESIGRPLPNRKMIVLSRDPTYKADGIFVVNSKEAVDDVCDPEKETWIIGGEQIYKLFLKNCQEIHITKILTDAGCDTFFPIDDLADAKQQGETLRIKEEKDEFETEYVILRRGIRAITKR